MGSDLKTPKARNLYLPKQVNQPSINALTQQTIEINEDDEHLIKLHEIHGINYTHTPLKMYKD